MDPNARLAEINRQIEVNKPELDALYEERQAARLHPPPLHETHFLLAEAKLEQKRYSLVAQGDSWFDYLPSWDLIDWLAYHHQHDIDNIGVAGSTLNDIAYGPVPNNLFGIPQSNHIDRLTELLSYPRKATSGCFTLRRWK